MPTPCPDHGLEFQDDCRICRIRNTAGDTPGIGSTQFDDLRRAAVPLSRTTTLQALPGHRVVRVHGLVTELVGAAGLTAGMKGREALSGATAGLRISAHEMGANAILGLTASTFGAGGGLTNVFGGDAVGVLLMGTAVFVEQDPTLSP